jgi:hypothetical protein
MTSPTIALEGKCLCGACTWSWNITESGLPKSATACSCNACRRYGVLWAYSYEDQSAGDEVKAGYVKTVGKTTPFVRGDRDLSFNFCTTCGCVVHYRMIEPDAEGRVGIAVNLRMSEPEPIAQIPIRHFDGLEQWKEMPADGRCVKDMWF